MSQIGWLEEFPSDWNYAGKAKLVLDDFQLLVKVNIYFSFSETIEIKAQIFWDDIPIDEHWNIKDKINENSNHKLIVRESLLLIGFTNSTNHRHTIPTEFQVYRLITYDFSKFNVSKEFENIFEDEIDCFQLRVYLSDEYSTKDNRIISEYINIPESYRNLNSNLIKKDWHGGLYCILNSGYEVQCGKQYSIHKDHTVPFFQQENQRKMYQLSFIDIAACKNKYNYSRTQLNKINFLDDLENILREACAFLSIVCGHEILPMYYEYSFQSQQRFFYGRVIPVCETGVLSKISKARSNPYLNFHHDVELFLECCPLDEKLVYGLYGLKQTVLKSASPLQLLAAYSALEYFYSFWLWEMNGIDKLIQAKKEKNNLVRFQKLSQTVLENLQDKKQARIPSLSLVIRLFLKDIDIDWEEYLNDDVSRNPEFIDVRDDLLHGVLISDEIKISYASDKATKIAKKVLFKIMKKISKSSNQKCYEELYIKNHDPRLIEINNGWSDIKQAHHELDNNVKNKIFWDIN